jgi:hypothetical protein
MRTTVLLSTLALLLACCRASEGPDPGKVPTQKQLQPATQPVLQFTFEASNAGYRVLDAQIVEGAPTLSIDQDRDVRITALDASGRPIGTVSVFNPRLARTAGATNPDQAVLDRGIFVVRFPRPESIQTVEIEVLRGPNEQLRRKLEFQARDERKR